MPTLTPEVEVERVDLPAKTGPDILLGAARYIEEHGWCQGNFHGPGGSVCAVGAIFSVGRPPDDALHALPLPDACRDAINRAETVIGGSITSWNDSPRRTRGDVLAALRKAATL